MYKMYEERDPEYYKTRIEEDRLRVTKLKKMRDKLKDITL
jgi:hypothetical protein